MRLLGDGTELLINSSEKVWRYIEQLENKVKEQGKREKEVINVAHKIIQKLEEDEQDYYAAKVSEILDIY